MGLSVMAAGDDAGSGGGLCPACSRYTKPGRCYPPFPPALFLLNSVGSEVMALGGWALICLHPGQLEADTHGSIYRPPPQVILCFLPTPLRV